MEDRCKIDVDGLQKSSSGEAPKLSSIGASQHEQFMKTIAINTNDDIVGYNANNSSSSSDDEREDNLLKRGSIGSVQDAEIFTAI